MQRSIDIIDHLLEGYCIDRHTEREEGSGNGDGDGMGLGRLKRRSGNCP